MRSVMALTAIFVPLCAAATMAAQPETFAEAKAQSAQTGKPILLEFVHDD